MKTLCGKWVWPVAGLAAVGPADGRIMQFAERGPQYRSDPRKARLHRVEQTRR